MSSKITAAGLVKENIWKNILIIIISLLFLPVINSKASMIGSDGYGNFLTVISILLVTVCFANFAFSYENAHINSKNFRILAHLATSLFLLLTVLLLMMMCRIINVAYPTVSSVVIVFSILLYLSVVLYDFWDLLKVVKIEA